MGRDALGRLVGGVQSRDLGNHVSGYRGYYPLDFEPGSRYSYIDTGFLLLGRIAEIAGRAPFAESLDTRLLKPLRIAMANTDWAGGRCVRCASLL